MNDETARQGVERGRNGALMSAVFFAFLAFDGWTAHNSQGTEVMTFFAVLFGFAGWRIDQGSAGMMDLAMILFPFGVGAALHAPAMQPGGHWSGARRISLCWSDLSF
ncbi:MAG TPA: hypothetical protein VGU25_11030 [Acidobacteriaceae bacterium]|nr:hypothetical protein [Acidobacteriaceae bacterium]